MQRGNNYHLGGGTVHRRRRRAFAFIVALCAAFFLIVGGGGWLFMSSPLFQITHIDITGNNLISHADVSNLLKESVLQGAWWKSVFGFENIFVWPNKISGARDFIFYPAIKSIEISKNYFRRTVSVKIEERQPIGIWCYHREARTNADDTQTNAEDKQNNTENFQRLSASSPRTSASSSSSPSPRESASSLRGSASPSCWWFDDEGMIFRQSPVTEGNLIAVVKDYSGTGRGLNSKVLPDRFMKNFLSIIHVMQKSSLDEKEILLKDLAVEEVEVLTIAVGSSSVKQAGPRLYFSLRFPADNTLAAIEHIKEMPGFKNLRYIDFRIENKVYYR